MRILSKIKPRKLIMLAVVSLCIALPGAAFATPTNQEFNTIMNLSGKQRMLSQKMAKEALFVVKGVDADLNRKNLKDTTDLFKKTLTGLKVGDASLGLPVHDFSRIQRELDKLQEVYNEIDPIYAAIAGGGTATNEQLAIMDQKSLAVLAQADKIVGLFELETKSVTGVGNQELAAQINIAGRQRMLSQKITKEFLLSAQGVNADANKAAMNATVGLFESSLDALKAGNKEMGFGTGVQDPATLAQLDVVGKSWQEFKLLVQNGTDSPEAIAKIKDMNLSLMKEADKVVQSLSALNIGG